MSDAPWKQQSRAVTGSEQGAWVVDLASRRIVRIDAVLAPVPADAGTTPCRKEWRAGLDLPTVARARAARQKLPDGDARSILVGRHQHQNQDRSESVSRPQDYAGPFDRSQIEDRAYAIYCARGCVDGLDVDDWLEAERQLRSEARIEDATPQEAEPARVGEPGSD